jgi:hypothetical protein
MTDTMAKISNFGPVRERDPSLRATWMPKGSFPPFYLLANVDIWVENPPESLADMVNDNAYCRYGRPHWGALMQQFSEGQCSIIDLMSIARAKLLGGTDYSYTRLDECPALPPAEALAILGVRMCLDLVPQCQLSHDMVAQNMRTLYHISESRDSIITGYFSEPVLVQAAAQLTNCFPMHAPSPRWTPLLESLLQSLKNGQVNAGFRGELVARILLVMSWDACCLKEDAQRQSFASGVFLKAVPLISFLDSLLFLGDDVTADLSKSFRNGKQRAWVRCSHFVKIDYVPKAAQLLELFRRGAAAVTKELQAGTDLIIPIAFCQNQNVKITEEMVTCMFVQVKNRKGPDPGYPDTATTLQTPDATGIQIAPNLPYLSLYMSLGPNSNTGGLTIERPRINIPSLRNTKPIDFQECIAVFTISETVYRVLSSESAQLLRHINQCWIDPLTLHECADDHPLIANMLPCQHVLPRERIPAAGRGRSGRPVRRRVLEDEADSAAKKKSKHSQSND